MKLNGNKILHVKSAFAINRGYVSTGDIASIDEQGWYYVHGRADGQLFKAPDESKFHISAMAGYIQSKIAGSFVDYQMTHYFGRKPELVGQGGIEAEASVRVNVFNFLYAKTGLGYNEQGGEIKYNNLVYPIDVKLRYVHVPVSIGVYLLTVNKFSVAAEGGIQFNQEISSDQEFKKGNINKNQSKTFVPAYTYELLIQYRISDLWKIQGSYKRLNSLNNFYKEDYFDSYVSMKTNAESYSVGVLWSLK